MKAQSIDFVKDVLSNDKREFGDYLQMFFYAFEMPFLKRNRPSGVYLLGDFYVGKSIDYAARISDHRSAIKSALNGYGTSGKTSADGVIRWLQRFENRRIPVFHMSNEHQDEYKIATNLIENGFPIVNNLKQCDGYYNFNMTDKESDCIRYLRGLGYSVEIPEARKHLIIPNN